MLPQAQAELVYWEIDQFVMFIRCDQVETAYNILAMMWIHHTQAHARTFMKDIQQRRNSHVGPATHVAAGGVFLLVGRRKSTTSASCTVSRPSWAQV